MDILKNFINDKASFALLEDTKSKQNKHYLLTNAFTEIIAYKPPELKAAFKKIESLGRQGFYLCGYMAYEAGYHFIDKKINPSFFLSEPLLYFVAFENMQTYIPCFKSNKPLALYDFYLSQNMDDYIKTIHKIKNYIKNGDIYQANYTLKYNFSFSGDILSLYKKLRQSQPVEYGALLHFEQKKILSFSPELFVKKTANIITSQPMKGTAKRGKNKTEDQKIIRAMQKDEKTLAENLMIVDLMRNDLSRICKVASIKVKNLFKIKTYQSLHQMVSTIQGELRKNISLYDIFHHIFPCGSITGAPKIRTMEIIAKLEKTPRDVYTGALGYILPNQDFCFNIPIRTLTITDKNKAQMGIGSGIVYDSQPLAEYKECLLKAQFLKNANGDFYLFETMHCKNGNILLLEYHLKRLQASAFFFDFPFDTHIINQQIVTKTQNLSGMFRVKLCLHYNGHIEFIISPFHADNRIKKLMISEKKVHSQNIWLYHKTSHRNFYEQQYEQALNQGYDEVIFCNEKNELTEASRHNLIINLKGRLYTPPISSGLLPGVFRQKLLDDKKITEKTLTLKDVQKSQEIFIINGLNGLKAALLF